MKIILLGAPGSGKGTQAELIERKYHIPRISTGDIFRANIKNKTAIGLEAKKYIDQGLLVPDEVTLSIVENRFMEEDCKEGFLLDGFPRTLVQAEALETDLAAIDKKLDAVINLQVSDEAILDRMTGRRICSNCGASYHVIYSKLKVENICDKCGGELIIRDDDKFETVKNRLDVYKRQTEPLIEYYGKKGILITINGELSAEQVFEEIVSTLE